METQRKTQYCGIWVCSVGFFLLFTAFLNVQARITTVFSDLQYQSLGPYVIATLYFSFSISTFFAPQFVKCLKYRCSLVIGSSAYTLFVLADLIPAAKEKYNKEGGIFSDASIYFLTCFTAFLLGFFSQVIWVAQGSYFTEISDPRKLGISMSILWIFFSSAYILGSLLTALTYTEAFYFFILMAAISLLANIVFCFIPSPKGPHSQPEADSARHIKQEEQNTPLSGPQKVNCVSVCKLACTRQMLLFTPFLFHTGIVVVLIAIIISDTAATFAKDYDGVSQSEANRLSSFLLLTTGISEFVSSFPIGRCLDKCSGCVNLLNYLVIGAICYILMLSASFSRSFNLIWFFASAFIGFLESYFNTMINVFFGRTFKAQTKEAFALFRGYQALGAAVGSFITPFFLKNTWRQGLIGFFALFFLVSCFLPFFTDTAKRKQKIAIKTHQ